MAPLPRGALQLALLAGAFAVQLGTTPFAIVDDAYIPWRYAHNLVSSGELVFNPGERVEGFTSLLWLVLCLPAEVAGFPIEAYAVALSCCLVAATSGRLWQLGSRLRLDGAGALVAPLGLLLSGDFFAASGSGLEVGLYAFLLTELLYRHVADHRFAVWVVGGLLFCTRPESLVIILVLGLLELVKTKRPPRARGGLAGLAVVVAGVTLSRWVYFGALVPNTVIAKSIPMDMLPRAAVSGAAYFISFVDSNLLMAACAAAGSFLVVKAHRLREDVRRGAELCAVGIGVGILVMLRNGGGWMPDHRLLGQYSPFYFALFSLGLASAPERVSVGLRRSFLVVLSLLAIWTAWRARAWQVEVTFRDVPGAFWTDVTRRLTPVVRADDLISAEAIGYIGYRLAGIPIHDPVGLVDAEIARYGRPNPTFGRTAPRITFEREPSVLVWHNLSPVRQVEAGVLDHYVTYCARDCGEWRADVVMIRRDVAGRVAPAFEDWVRVVIGANGPQPVEG